MEFSTLNEQKLRIKTEWFVLNREEPKIGLALVDNMPSPYDQVKYFPVCLQNRLISAGLEKVLSYTEKSCIALY